MNIAEYAIRFIYPPRCFVCGSLMDFWSEDFICGKCMKNISYAENGQDYGYEKWGCYSPCRYKGYR